MPLTWDNVNLVAHTAKHYLGDRSEFWRELPGAPQQAWDDWRTRADAARCRYDEHPNRCHEPHVCGGVHNEASPAYRDLVDNDWAFAEQHALLVEYRDERGQRSVCGTGTFGVFVAAAAYGGDWQIAKTAFRPSDAPRGGRDPVLGAVRKMRAHTSTRAGGRSKIELINLETRLLRPMPDRTDPIDLLANALRMQP